MDIRGHLETSADIHGHADVTSRHNETGPTPQMDRAGSGCLPRSPPEDGQMYVAAFEGPERCTSGGCGNAVADDRLALQGAMVPVAPGGQPEPPGRERDFLPDKARASMTDPPASRLRPRHCDLALHEPARPGSFQA